MDGLKGDELDGFIKLRAYQKQDKQQANASTTTVLQGASEPKRRKTAKPTFDGIGFDRFFLMFEIIESVCNQSFLAMKAPASKERNAFWPSGGAGMGGTRPS